MNIEKQYSCGQLKHRKTNNTSFGTTVSNIGYSIRTLYHSDFQMLFTFIFFKWYLYLFHGVCCEALPIAYREFCVKDMTKTMAQEGSVKD